MSYLETAGEICCGPSGELASHIGRCGRMLVLPRATPNLRFRGKNFIREKNLYPW